MADLQGAGGMTRQILTKTSLGFEKYQLLGRFCRTQPRDMSNRTIIALSLLTFALTAWALFSTIDLQPAALN
jgi:hypothetical protein